MNRGGIYTEKSEFQKLEDNLLASYIPDKEIIIIHNKQYAISYVMDIRKGIGRWLMPQVFFKGMSLGTSQFNNLIVAPYSKYMHLRIYLDGFPTKEYLTLNREKIREEKVKTLLILSNMILDY